MREKYKVQIVVLDIEGCAMEWLDKNADEDHMDLCEVLTLNADSPIAIRDLPMYDNWDILLVFERGVRKSVASLLHKIGISDDRVIYPLDTDGSLLRNRDISSYIFGNYIRRLLRYLSCRALEEEYALVSIPEFTYINSSTDNVILPSMIRRLENWAKDEMELFYKLAGEYFEFNDKQNIFCDIGANIGTTCIYFKKKLDKGIRILAFEPVPENYKLLKANAIINDIDIDEHLFMQVGVSDVSSNGSIKYNPSNPGGSSAIEGSAGESREIRLTSFDDFIEEYTIDPTQIKYMWVDVEGYEGRFLKGARKTLGKINIPVFMEFIPRFYLDRVGEFETLVCELERNFDFFISIQHMEWGSIPIVKLRDMENNMDIEWDIFLMKG